MRLLSAAVAAALLLGGCGAKGGNGSLAARGEAFTLKFNFEKGAKYSYLTTMKMSQTGGPMPMDVTMSLTSGVEILDKTDQSFKAKTTISDAKVDSGKDAGLGALLAGTVTSINGTSVEAVYDSTGKRTETNVQSGNPTVKAVAGAGGLDFGFMGLVCPGKPISKGSTWETTVDVGKMLGGMGSAVSTTGASTLPVKFRLVGVENSDGKAVAQIAVEITGSINLTASGHSVTMDMNTKGDMHVDVDKGLLLDSDLTSDNTIKAGDNTSSQHLDIAVKLKG